MFKCNLVSTILLLFCCIKIFVILSKFLLYYRIFASQGCRLTEIFVSTPNRERLTPINSFPNGCRKHLRKPSKTSCGIATITLHNVRF